MACFSHEINTICRLCLSSNEATLLPTSKIIDSALSIDDIERFTGIRVEDDNVSYVICEDCHNKLRKFTAFRAFCLTNDVRFRKIVQKMIERDCQELITIQETIVQPTNVRLDKQIKNGLDNNFTITYVESTFDDHTEEVDGVKIDENSDGNEEVVEIIVQTDMQTNPTELNISLSPAPTIDQQHDELSGIDASTNEKRRKMPERIVQNAMSRITGKSKECKSQKKGARKPRISKDTKPTNQKQLCPMCGKLVHYLPDHIVSHTKEQKFSCEFCPMKCSRKSYLKLHMEAVHLKKVVKSCEICNRDFTHISGYAAHMRAQHNVGDWYVCKICNLKFRHPGGLNGHNNRKHNADSNCECPTCGMKFEDKKGLKDHSRVHSNEKPFACTFCPKRFKSPNAHRTHILIHKGVVFACTLCDKSYRYKSLLNAHMKKVHSQENFQDNHN